MKKPNRKSIGDAVCALGLPREALPNQSQILLIGRSELRAKTCCALEKYTENEVSVRLAKGRLRVVGKDLCISTFCMGNLTLRGVIDAIDLRAEGESV